MTYNVFSGMLKPTQSINESPFISWYDLCAVFCTSLHHELVVVVRQLVLSTDSCVMLLICSRYLTTV